MPTRRRPVRLGTALVALATLVAAGGASASHRDSPKNAATERLHSQHRRGSHTPHESSHGSFAHTPTTENFDVLAHARLPQKSPHGDVYFYDHGGEVGKHVYVGTWAVPCSGTGVKIIDVNDPASPMVVDLAGRRRGSSNEDMAVVRIGDRDILGVGVQSCGTGGKAGLRLIDVTDPSNARKLSFIPVPAAGVHELDLTVRVDGRALALLAVPFSEFDDVYGDEPTGGDFRIVDITDPSNPVPLSDWGVIADSSLPIPAGDEEISSPFQGTGYFSASYGHSVRAADDGMSAYVSYWDAGVLKFDMSDPADPQLVARTTYPFVSDGDGHSMTPYEVGGKTYILQNDEDFTPLSPTVVTSSATGADSFAGIEEEWMPTLLSETGEVSGEIFDAGDGCRKSDYNGGAGRIILVDAVDPFYEGIIDGWRVPCGIGSQLRFAIAEGPAAVLVNLISNDNAWGFTPSDRKLQLLQSEAEGTPAVQISGIDGVAEAIRSQLGGGSVTVTLTPQPTTWGFLRIFRADNGDDIDGDGIEDLEQVGAFSDLPHVEGELTPPAGTWSIHNTEVLGERAYSSWYSHGIVALSLEDPENPVKVGQFVPSPGARFRDTFGPPGPQVWGVDIDPATGIVYASDMRNGLWIVRPTGEAAPDL
jgi:hypothetical protein